ncbi:MAG: hypothetical protein U9R26_10050 [Campylobacterota bacterium]|nr:hypothetical protein [Campylobacterota bacterium]
MLSLAIGNFLIGTIGSLAIFLLMTRLDDEESFSAPFFIVVIGMACAALSILFGYLSTWIILGIYAISSIVEMRRSQ